MKCFVLIAGVLPAPLAAQSHWTAAPELRLASALGTLGDYMDRGAGFGLALRSGAGRVVLRTDASWTHFRARSVTRGYNGGSIPLGLTSSANMLVVQAGPEVSLPLGRFSFAAGAGGGVAH